MTTAQRVAVTAIGTTLSTGWSCRIQLPFTDICRPATNMHHAAYPAYDLMLLRDSPKMSKMVTACLGSIPRATSSITAASAPTFFASHICTWQLWPDLTSADGLGMKRLSKQLNTSALRCGKTVAARHRDPGEHDSMCCCHWYCIKHRLKRCIVFAGFNCPQSSKSDSSK